MSRITLDQELRTRLNGLNESMEVYDEAGNIVGCFLPEDEYWKLILAADRCPYTVEEVKRSLQEMGGRTLAEIWKDIESKK